jgi:hypothetical protein
VAALQIVGDNKHFPKLPVFLPDIERALFFYVAREDINKLSVSWFNLDTASGNLKKTFSVAPVPAQRNDGSDIAFNAGGSCAVKLRYQGIEKLRNHQKAVFIFQNQKDGSIQIVVTQMSGGNS